MSIEAQLNELLNDFEVAATGLFEITGRYGGMFESGMYRCAIAKPTKRMKAALSADREILVVASNFADQQQRTVKFAKRQIDRSDGRFESTIVIFIHNDPEGNLKLRNWGGDQGLSILPVFGGRGATTPAELERSLCFELYSHDPFDVTGPVSDDANFYGRRDEAIDLARKLQKGQIRACLGIRKVGKTSIINRVLREIRKNHDAVCIMIDCSRDDVWSLSAASLLDSLSSTISAASSSGPSYAPLAPNRATADIRVARERLEKAILACSRTLVIVFDEIDYVTPGSPTEQRWRTEFNPFWRNLRSIYQECARHGKALSVFVAGVSTYWFTVESVEGVENAALAFVPEEYLSPLPEGATVAMLRRLGKIAGLHIDEDAAVLIARATGNMPYWARKCGAFIHRHIPTSERPCKVEVSRAQPLIDAFVEEEGAAIAEVALRHLFRVHPHLLQATTACCSGKASTVGEPLKRTLRRYGVLSTKDELSGTMLNKAFASIRGEAEAATEKTLEQRQPRQAGLDEWAEEIAALGKRRNLLERRLRELVLNFVRYDTLMRKTGDVKDRVVAALPEAQRARFRHLTAEDALGKFNWTDLVKLLAREWTLFESLFGDKAAFLSAAEVINDRFDAHAKDADDADFALYRRSLRQLEDRLAKVQ